MLLLYNRSDVPRFVVPSSSSSILPRSLHPLLILHLLLSPMICCRLTGWRVREILLCTLLWYRMKLKKGEEVTGVTDGRTSVIWRNSFLFASSSMFSLYFQRMESIFLLSQNYRRLKQSTDDIRIVFWLTICLFFKKNVVFWFIHDRILLSIK